MEPTWDDLSRHPIPSWYQDAKLGLYMHWGVYSVPAFAAGRASSDKYSYGMYLPLPDEERFAGMHEHHVASYGDPHQFGYKEFVPQWRAQSWDPDAWVELFSRSGARFVGLNAEHHDSFLLWDSAHSEWNSARMGPQRDVVAELEQRVRAQGMRFFVSLHSVRNWRWYEHAYGHSPPFDVEDERYARVGGIYPPLHPPGAPPSPEYVGFWRDKLREVIDRFCPDYIWFDSCLNELPDDARRWALGYYYEAGERRGREVMVNNKRGLQFPEGVGVFNLEGHEMVFDKVRDRPWDTDAQILRSQWSFVAGDPVKPFAELLAYFVNVISMNGNLLLNVSPRADGTIPEEQQQRLRSLGAWLGVNGEAVYGSRAWSDHRLGDDIWFTQSKDGSAIYVFHRGWPGERLDLPGVPARQGTQVTLLGAGETLAWRAGAAGGVTVELPAGMRHAVQPADSPIVVFRIALT